MSETKRTIFSLNDGWKFYQNGVCSEVRLPHTWNAVDGQDGGNDYYRGTCRYVRTLKKPAAADGARIFLEIKGAAMSAEVRLNGDLLAAHQGGYSTFGRKTNLKFPWITATTTRSTRRKRTLPSTGGCTGM